MFATCGGFAPRAPPLSFCGVVVVGCAWSVQHTKRLAFAVEMRSPTSGDEDDDQYGSEAQVETQEKMGSELSHKYQGPEWDGKKESYTEWRWEATPYLDSLGLESVRRGRNRSVTQAEVKVLKHKLSLVTKLPPIVLSDPK